MDRRFRPPGVPEGVAEVGVNFRRLRPQPQRRLEGGDGLADATERPQGVAEVAVIGSHRGIKGYGAGDHPDGLVRPPALEGDHPQKMQSGGMVGIIGEQPAVDRFGLVETTGLVMPQPLLQHRRPHLGPIRPPS